MLEEALKAAWEVGNRFYDTRWRESCPDRSEIGGELAVEIVELVSGTEQQSSRHTVLEEPLSRAGAHDKCPALWGGGVFWQGVVYRHPEYGKPLI